MALKQCLDVLRVACPGLFCVGVLRREEGIGGRRFIIKRTGCPQEFPSPDSDTVLGFPEWFFKTSVWCGPVCSQICHIVI